jgi:polyisoprenoid-binding protein YceI
MNFGQMKIRRRIRIVSSAALLSVALIIVGCRTPPIQTTTPAVSSVPANTENIPTVPVRYQIQNSSLLHILVYRGGALARLGHNHVISSHDVQGSINFNPQLSQSTLSITLPVQTLTVDEADARAQEGEDFSAAVPDDARQGTRGNMMRPEVLDGEHYPNITLRSVHIEGTPTAPTLTLQATLKAVTREVVVPVQVAFGTRSLTASGEFTIKQTDFGITPFNIGMGALKVQNELRIRFRIDALIAQ